MSRIFLILVSTLVIGLDSFTRVYGDDESTRGGVPECTGEGIYRPFNTWRKFQLAAAYFVDPASQGKARLGTVYSLESVIFGQNADKIIKELEDKIISLVVPLTKESKDSFSAVDSKCIFERLVSSTSTEHFSGKFTITDIQEWSVRLNLPLEDTYVLVEEGDIPSVDVLAVGKPVIAWDPKSPVNPSRLAKAD